MARRKSDNPVLLVLFIVLAASLAVFLFLVEGEMRSATGGGTESERIESVFVAVSL